MLLDACRPHPCYGGLDLGAVSDLTALALAWPIGDLVYAHAWYWLPEDDLEARSKHDNVPYVQWAKDGYLELTPGNVTDWRAVTAKIKDLASHFDIREIGFDRYGARDTASDLNEAGVVVADVGQGFISMNAPTKRLQELAMSRKIVHAGHPILRWNVDCAMVAQDPAGNLKPVKPDRRKSTKRIDGVVALIMAIGRATVNGAMPVQAAEVW